MNIIWTELAIGKLQDFADYIALDTPAAALKWIDKIQNSVRNLENFPESGRKVPEIKRDDIREIIEGNYRVIYRIEEKRISILTIRHAKQLFDIDNLQ